eukprot:TRINITY_DN11557_c0_g1_i1.p3 TRINITY_DN11557_c0_g1~~TRINITY_DN11557_c0_g1_i1.p3  ORF type:complete len:53 (-),score=1.21 TRINITY_DN11557_c0_g1_i1:84-242(-)
MGLLSKLQSVFCPCILPTIFVKIRGTRINDVHGKGCVSVLAFSLFISRGCLK